MEKTGIREPLNSPIPHPGPLDSAPGPAPTTRGILQNLPATPSAGEPASSAGSRRTPSQRVRGGLSGCVLILRFRKSARACKAIHRPCEQSTPIMARYLPSAWRRQLRPLLQHADPARPF